MANIDCGNNINKLCKKLRKELGVNLFYMRLEDLVDSIDSKRALINELLKKPMSLSENHYLLLDNKKKDFLQKDLYKNRQKNLFKQRSCLHVMHQKH